MPVNKELTSLEAEPGNKDLQRVKAAAAGLERGERRKRTHTSQTSSPAAKSPQSPGSGTESSPASNRSLVTPIRPSAKPHSSNTVTTPTKRPKPQPRDVTPRSANQGAYPVRIGRRAAMSSQRRGAARNGPRGGSDDGAINRHELYDDIRKAVGVIAEGERKSKGIKEKILSLESKMKHKRDNDIGML